MCTLNAANLPEALSHPLPDLSEFTAMFWSCRDTHRVLTTRPTDAGCPRCDVRGARDDLGLYQTHRLDMSR